MNIKKIDYLYYCLFFFNIIIPLYVIYRLYTKENVIANIGYIIFIILSLIFLIISLYFYKYSKNKDNFLLVIFSLLFFVYFFEFILSFRPVYNFVNDLTNLENDKRWHSSNTNKIKLKFNPGFDMRSKYEYYIDETSKGRDIMLSYSPSILNRENFKEGIEISEGKKIFPLSKKSNQETILCNESGLWEKYTTDQFGFNNPDNSIYDNVDFALMGDAYPEGQCVKGCKMDVVMVGDSYTEGQCFDYPESMASQLTKLSNKNILNLGVGGNGPLVMLGQIIEYVTYYKPEVVIWTHFDNDVHNLKVEEQFSPLLMKYLNDESFSQNLINRQNEIDEAVKFIHSYLLEKGKKTKKVKVVQKKYFDFNIVSYVKLQYLRQNFIKDYLFYKLYNKIVYTINKNSHDKEFYDLYEKIILRAQKIVNNYGGKIVFVYLPDMITIYNDIGDHYMPGTREKTLQVWKRNNLDYLDITDFMIEKSYSPEELFIYGIWGNHYTKLGYKIASDAIYEHNISKKFSN